MLRLSASLAIVISAPLVETELFRLSRSVYSNSPSLRVGDSGSHVELKRLGFAHSGLCVLIMPQIFKTVTLGRFTCAWRARKATAHPLSAKFEASEPIIAASKGVSIGANIVQLSTSTHNPFRECFPTKS
jgi:hypothetical protein